MVRLRQHPDFRRTIDSARRGRLPHEATREFQVRQRDPATNGAGVDRRYGKAVFCARFPSGQATGPVKKMSAVRFWEVGMTHLKDGLCTPAIPADFDSAMLQVSKFRLTKKGLFGAPQLALLRHLWAEAVLATSPEAVVFGGQHHWQDGWWTEELGESTSS
jgi:hypothetical protein